jgi:tetratricopeptide (TPR) repeat protein
LAWFEDAIEIDPGHRSTYWGIGRHYWKVSGQLDEAVVWYMKAISLFPGEPIPLEPGEPDYLADLGWFFLDLGDRDRAEYWFERSTELGPERPEGKMGIAFLHLYRGDEPAAVDYVRKVRADFPRSWGPLVLLRNHEVSSGRYAEARTLYEKTHPELLSNDDPEVGGMNLGPAFDLALVLFKTGETERADLLLNRSLQYIHAQPRLSIDASLYRVYVAQIFALQGKKQKALSAFRQAINEGWRREWWHQFEHEPNFESLRGEPEFQAMREEVRAEMAQQLENLREMERTGELASIPRDEANLH